MTKMTVTLVKSPVIQSLVRGAGFYGKNLEEALRQIPGLEIAEVNTQIVHYLYFDPFFLTLPPIRKQKTVVTVFDLIPLVLPDLYPPGLRGKIKWQIQKNILKTVDHIITISESAKKDINKIIGIPEEKIKVVYLAADPIFKPIKTNKENFVLYVGGVNWNKNVISLVKACQKIKIPLVLVGKEFVNKNVDWSNVENQPLKEILKQVQDDNLITIKGFVESSELVKLYNQAKVYVQPSIYEGFGLPVLEAMACGTPVICGENSSLPEIAGDAATYADVSDPADLADKIRNIKPSGKELAQAAKFSWEKTARETLKVYEKVLSQ